MGQRWGRAAALLGAGRALWEGWNSHMWGQEDTLATTHIPTLLATALQLPAPLSAIQGLQLGFLPWTTLTAAVLS